MPGTTALDILKSAILLEIRGKDFYENAADSAQDPVVKEFFQKMAEDEAGHIQLLSDQFNTVQSEGKFGDWLKKTDAHQVADMVLSDELKQRIRMSGFESAAISAAMGMEERAIQLYTQQAKAATDPKEKGLYQWLAEWETHHLESLAKIDREVTESIWNDNSFWPF
jgi:rubrerythrin